MLVDERSQEENCSPLPGYPPLVLISKLGFSNRLVPLLVESHVAIFVGVAIGVGLTVDEEIDVLLCSMVDDRVGEEVLEVTAEELAVLLEATDAEGEFVANVTE
jgi:hypothetical protein